MRSELADLPAERRGRVRLNPAWTNNALARSWDAIERRVGPSLMPRLSSTRELDRIAAVEYGSGVYGTVMPTSRPGWVVKVTSDPSEAQFAMVSQSLKPYPPGVVRYGKVFRIPGVYDGRPIYILWREEAYDIGKTLRRHREPDERAAYLLGKIRQETYPAFQLLREPETRARYLDDVRRYASRFVSDRPRTITKIFDTAASGAGRGLAMAAGHIEELAREPGPAQNVGRAMQALASRGIILGDVHTGNLGFVKRGGQTVSVITDPGQAIFLTDRYDRFKPTELPATTHRYAMQHEAHERAPSDAKTRR